MTHYPMDSSGPNPTAIEERAAPAGDADFLRKRLDEQRDLNLRLAEDFGDITRRVHREAEARGSAQKQAFIDGLIKPIDSLEWPLRRELPRTRRCCGAAPRWPCSSSANCSARTALKQVADLPDS